MLLSSSLFDWEIDVSPRPPPKKKKVVRVYCILKHCGLLLDIIMQNIVYDY